MADGVPLVLTGGAYQAKSVLAGAQSCENLYMESIPEETKPPTPPTHYCRPGKSLIGSPPLSGAGNAGAGRGLYTASDGQLYAVIGSTVYSIDQTWRFNT